MTFSEEYRDRMHAQAEVMGEPADPQPFDLVTYRENLEAKRAAMISMERQYHSKWLADKHDYHFQQAEAFRYKVYGIEMAIALLPLVTTEEV